MKQSETIKFEGRAAIDYRAFLGTLVHREPPLPEMQIERSLTSLEEVKVRSGLAFNVVFQRALVLAYLDFARVTAAQLEAFRADYSESEEPDFDFDFDEDVALSADEDVEELDVAEVDINDADDSAESASGTPSDFAQQRMERSHDFVRHLNAILTSCPELLALDCDLALEGEDPLYVWNGSLRKPEGGIDFTQGASGRAKDILFALVMLSCMYELAQGDLEFDHLWLDMISGDGSPLVRRTGLAIRRTHRDDGSISGRVLRSRDVVPTAEPLEADARARFASLWDVIPELGSE